MVNLTSFKFLKTHTHGSLRGELPPSGEKPAVKRASAILIDVFGS